MPQLSNRTATFTDSVIRRMTRISNKFGAVNLSQGFPDFEPPKEILDFAAGYGDKFEMTDCPKTAAKDADVLITDVWASMGQEGEAEKRKKAFAGYQINDELMTLAKADAMVLHCLPAHREEEITEKVFEAHANEIFEEAENRLHAQKAVMVKVMGGKPKYSDDV